MPETDRPHSWAPYLTWMKRAPQVSYNLMGSNLLHCLVEDIPGAREELALSGPNDEGYGLLLDDIATHYGVDSDRVSVANGASGANFLACGAVLEAGDEVLVERSAYDPLLGVPRFLGAQVNRFDRVFEEGFQVDPDRVAAALTPGTRLIILSNLHNPTGAFTSQETLKAVGELAEGVGARVLVDEVYLDSVHELDGVPAGTISPTFISTSSLTKAYGLAGLKAGWTLSSPEIAEKVRRLRDIVDGSGAFPSEGLSHLAFGNLPALRARARGILEPNHASLVAFIQARPELEWVPPVGGSVGFPRIVGMSDVSDFVVRLREEYDTGVVPGHFFDAPAHFRIALGGYPRILEEGLNRLGQALDNEFG